MCIAKENVICTQFPRFSEHNFFLWQRIPPPNAKYWQRCSRGFLWQRIPPPILTQLQWVYISNYEILHVLVILDIELKYL